MGRYKKVQFMEPKRSPEFVYLEDPMWATMLAQNPCRKCGRISVGAVIHAWPQAISLSPVDWVCAACADDVLAMRQLECLVVG